MRRVLLAVVLVVAGCGEDEGPYEAHLLIEDAAGGRHEFPLGGRASYDACGELGAYEAAQYEGGQFWADPQLTYGGRKGGDDWTPYRVLGFTCRSIMPA